MIFLFLYILGWLGCLFITFLCFYKGMDYGHDDVESLGFAGVGAAALSLIWPITLPVIGVIILVKRMDN